MHVLQRRGGDVHVHLVAAQLLRQRTPVGVVASTLSAAFAGRLAAPTNNNAVKRMNFMMFT
jgi:hypothetical protein